MDGIMYVCIWPVSGQDVWDGRGSFSFCRGGVCELMAVGLWECVRVEFYFWLLIAEG